MHPQTLWHAFCSDTHAPVHAGIRTRAHTPHGAGNMSEQSRVWHVNQSLLLEVRRDSAGEDSPRRRVLWKRFRFLCLAMRVRDLQIPKTLISSCWAAPSGATVHLPFFVVVASFHLKPCCIFRKGATLSKAAAVLWLCYCRGCGVAVKATEKDEDSPAVRLRQNSSRMGEKMHPLSGCYGNLCKNT